MKNIVPTPIAFRSHFATRHDSNSYTTVPFLRPSIFCFALPETAPSDVVLAEVFQIRRLTNEAVDLVVDSEFLGRAEISARELLLDAAENLQRACILLFPGLRVAGWRDARAVARPER